MEIVIQDKGIIDLGRSIKQATFDIFSTDKLYPHQYLELGKALFNGQSHSYEELDINKETSLPHKYLYKIKITCDSSD